MSKDQTVAEKAAQRIDNELGFRDGCPNAYRATPIIQAAIDEETKPLVDALEAILNRYVGLANSGDCGFWNPEDEEEVKGARAALAPFKEGGDAK